MAEIGVIASGMGVASLGLQLMDGIRKLKQFWDEVKEAPEDIQYTLEELETLSLILSDIQTSDSNMPSIPSATATRCLELCRRGTDILNTTVKDLNGAISKRRKIGSAKVVLKKDTLEKFRNRLRDAQYMLMLSRQTYSDALQMEYHKLQIEAVQSNANRQLQEFEELKVSITRSADVMSRTMLRSRDTVVYDFQKKRPTRNRTRNKLDKEAKYFHRKFRIPQWFSSPNYTWDFSGYQAPSGWTFNFRQYYTVDRQSSTWECVRKGDLSGLQVLLQNKKATPFDRLFSGETLLDLASSTGDIDMCRLLLNQGADPNDSFATSALSYSINHFMVEWNPFSSMINVLQLLYPITEIHNPLEDIRVLYEYDGLAWLLRHIDPTFKEWSFEERMIPAERGLQNDYPTSSDGD
ncbi:ankyrin repeat-containing protein [Botrytis cinerea]